MRREDRRRAKATEEEAEQTRRARAVVDDRERLIYNFGFGYGKGGEVTGLTGGGAGCCQDADATDATDATDAWYRNAAGRYTCNAGRCTSARAFNVKAFRPQDPTSW